METAAAAAVAARPERFSWLKRYWQGPPGLAASVELEWRLIAIRLPSIAVVSVALPLLPLPASTLKVAYLLLAFALVYVLALRALVLRSPSMVANGYLPTLVDAFLTLALVALAGGISSPFYVVLFTVAVASAMRYGYGPALLIPAAFLAMGVYQYRVQGLTPDAGLDLRPIFLALAVGAAGCLTEQTRLAERDQRQRVWRASLLNEVSAALAASLDPRQILETVPESLRRLFGDQAVVVLRMRQAGAQRTTIAGAAAERLAPYLADLAQRSAESSEERQLASRNWRVEACGQESNAVVARLGGSRAPLAVVAWALPQRDWLEKSDTREVVEAFCSRLALAIENAGLYHRLEDRQDDLRRAYGQLTEAHQELVKVDDMKTNFLANVSHEFRTPLTSIRSFSEMLMTYDWQADMRDEFVTIINAESERLTRMVEDVLDITKIESGSMEWNMQPLDMQQLLRAVGKVQRPLIERRGLQFEEDIAELPLTYGDSDRLQQVANNLLHNALKFTAQGGIRLAARARRGEIEVEVTDTGVGVAERDHERIFRKFQQVGEVVAAGGGGTGLGLSICREIVEHHGGRIWVESEPGRGSSFKLALPLPQGVEMVDGRVAAADGVGALDGRGEVALSGANRLDH